MAQSLKLILLLTAVAPSICQPCASKDFGVAYQGNTIFMVSSSNNTCMCENYATNGVAKFQNAEIARLTVGTLTASSGGIQVPAGVLLDLGYGAPGRDSNAGKIGYGAPLDNTTVNIVGMGATPGSRQVKVLDVLHVGELVHIDGAFTCGGLRGYYYTNTELREPYACTMVNPTLVLAYGGSGGCGACGGGVPCTGYSTRWSGYVLAPVTGNVSLSAMADDGVRLWWNNDPTPIIDSWQIQNVTTTSAVVSMVQGRYYAIRVEYFQNVASYFLLLQWEWPGHALDTVPSSNLCTAGGVHVAFGTSRFDGQVAFNGPVFFNDGIGSIGVASLVNGPLSVQGITVFNDAVTANGNVAIAGTRTLSVGGASSFTGSVNIGAAGVTGNGNLGVAGTVRVQGATTLLGGATVTGGATLDTVSVSGTSTLNGAVTSAGNVAITGSSSLTVGGAAGFTGAVNIGSAGVSGNGNLGVAGTLAVLGASSFTGSVNIGAAGVTGNGNLGVAGTVRVQGAATLLGGATVTGGATLDTVSVSGTSTLNGAVTSAGNVAITGSSSLTVGGAAGFTGAVNVGSAGVSGNGNLGVAGTLTVLGGVTLNNGINVNGAATFAALTVSGPATFNAGVNIPAGGLSVSNGSNFGGTVTVAGLVTFNNGLTVNGASTALNTGLTVSGPTTFAGAVSIPAAGGLSVTNAANFAGTVTAAGLGTFNNGATVNGAAATLNAGLSVTAGVVSLPNRYIISKTNVYLSQAGDLVATIKMKAYSSVRVYVDANAAPSWCNQGGAMYTGQFFLTSNSAVGSGSLRVVREDWQVGTQALNSPNPKINAVLAESGSNGQHDFTIRLKLTNTNADPTCFGLTGSIPNTVSPGSPAFSGWVVTMDFAGTWVSIV
eukprot:TRINITY_DN843_c1_g1_i2.p1 TRINITY_DN843_c1_g1~~TRINITY_DN843_c1_g1_i2.p1  ORF type:complete len:883 (+),score=161.29 TRINITY_DN843_c1_g1_i2:89-2737(+)